jgi:hypothetical protein
MIYTKQMLEAMILPIVEDAKDNPQKATAALVDLIMQDRKANAHGFYSKFIEIINSGNGAFEATFTTDIAQNAKIINDMIVSTVKKAAGIDNELPG